MVARKQIGQLPPIDPTNVAGDAVLEIESGGVNYSIKLSDIGGYVAPGGIPSLTPVENDLAAVQASVNQLLQTYDTTVAAIDAAAAAEVARLQAVTQKGLAETMAQYAIQARDVAVVAQTAAETAKDASEAGQAAAELARDQAQTSATNASGSASAAAGSAQTATTQATNAGNSATAAAASVVAAQAATAALFPDRYTTGTETSFKALAASAITGAPNSITSTPSNYTLAGYGPLYQAVSASETYLDFGSVGVLPATAGKTYQVEVEYEVVAFTGNPSIQVFFRSMDSAYGSLSTTSGSALTLTSTGTFTRSYKISNVAATGVGAWHASAIWLRPFIRLTKNSGTYTVRIKRLTVQDVTAQSVAETWAGAAATSAASANTSAQSALGSKTSAETAAATATTKATQASQSETNAAGSASQAATSQQAAATSAAQSGNSATAAAGSAQTATTQANAAGSSASAADVSRLAAASHATANLVAKGIFGDGSLGTWNGTVSVFAVSPAAPDGATSVLRSQNRDAFEGALLDRPLSSRVLRLTGYARAPGQYPCLVGFHTQNTSAVNAYTGAQVAAASTTTWQAFDVTITLPSSAVRGRPWVQSNGTAGQGTHDVQVTFLRIEDVTERTAAQASAAAALGSEVNASNYAATAQTYSSTAAGFAGTAQTNAQTATAQASAATGQAALASQSATLAASAGVNSLNANPRFTDYPTTPGQPTSWALWAGSQPTRVTGELPNGYAAQDSVGAGGAQGSSQTKFQTLGLDGIKTGDWFVLEGHVRLDSGTLQGAGIHIQYCDAAVSVIDSDSLHFYTDPDSTGAAVGAGTVGKVYRFAKLVKGDVAGITNCIIYRMTGWTGFGTVAAKTLTWFRCSVRPATQAEIRDQTVLAPMEATVAQHTTAIATTNTALATLEQRVTAGNPNLLPNGGFEKGLQGWATNGGSWSVTNANGWGPYAIIYNQTAIQVIVSSIFSVYPNTQYTISADLLCFATNSNAHIYVDIIYRKADGSIATGGDSGQNAQYATFDFSVSNARRAATACTSTAPADATQAQARVVINPNGATITAAGARQIKVERGATWTPYSSEATAAFVAGALATVEGKTAAYLELTTAAGGSTAAVKLNASGQSSSVELQANAIRLGSSNLPAMDVVGGNVYFYGKVTAQSIDTAELKIGGVSTDRLALNAVTGTVSAFSPSTPTWTVPPPAWYTLQSLTIGTTGYPVLIHAGFNLFENNVSNLNINLTFRLTRNGTVLTTRNITTSSGFDGSTNASFNGTVSLLDSPGGGNVTYALEIAGNAIAFGSGHGPTDRFLSATEIKR